MVYHPDDTAASPGEDTKDADIFIPVPYDPQIPGVRCVDADKVENVALVTTLSDDGGENIDLRDLGQGEDRVDLGAHNQTLVI